MAAQHAGAPAGKRRRTAPSIAAIEGDSANRTSDRKPPGIATSRPEARHYFACPVCGNSRGSANYVWTRRYSAPRWIVSCYSCEVDGLDGGAYLRALAEAVGTTAGKLLSDPAPWLAGRRVESPAARGGGPGRALPNVGEVAGWSRRLLASRRPLDWLLKERGLTLEVIEAARVGWDGKRLVFPMLRDGEVVAAKWRLPRSGAQMIAWPGRGRDWPLYPEPDPSAGWALLVEGELDALRARAAGLPAASVTLGAATWRNGWAAQLDGLRVLVCFDVGAERFSRRAATRLGQHGIRARRLDLRTLGIRERGADMSDYLNGGGDPDAIRRVAER